MPYSIHIESLKYATPCTQTGRSSIEGSKFTDGKVVIWEYNP